MTVQTQTTTAAMPRTTQTFFITSTWSPMQARLFGVN
jgi:hypothetical protein